MTRCIFSAVLLLRVIAPASWAQNNLAPSVEKKVFHLYLLAGQSNMVGNNYFGPICTERFPGIDKHAKTCGYATLVRNCPALARPVSAAAPVPRTCSARRW